MSSAYWVGVRIDTAISLVTWSPAIGMTAVWRIAPPLNTAMSVVPPPTSTMQTPSSFSSSVSTAKLEASCSSTMSSTARPQRCTHLTMFCAALSAPVTMWTLASSRTPDMPMGSRIPSCVSMMYSWGSTCRIFWSAGIATALAASITRSTSPCTTSLSLMATMPCELRLRTWLPAMPAYTEWISHPAISSASSTARWMDCTVDSMFTTTPFFNPRDGWLPMPMISSAPSDLISPTMATTLLVPMSRPTNKFRSERFAMSCASVPLCVAVVGALGRPGAGRRLIAPADGKAIGIAHVHVVDFRQAVGDDLGRGADEAVDAFVHLAPSQTHGYAAVQIHFPCAALIEAQRRDAHAGFEHSPLRRQIALRHLKLGALRAAQSRQFRRYMRRVLDEQLAAGVQEA